jgi:hypothetical protein
MGKKKRYLCTNLEVGIIGVPRFYPIKALVFNNRLTVACSFVLRGQESFQQP